MGTKNCVTNVKFWKSRNLFVKRKMFLIQTNPEYHGFECFCDIDGDSVKTIHSLQGTEVDLGVNRGLLNSRL
jgi:hypothetical protein